MPPVVNEDKPQLRKSYLISLGVAGLVGLVLIGPRVFDSLRQRVNGPPEKATFTIVPGPNGKPEDLRAISKDLVEFQQWVTHAAVPGIVIVGPESDVPTGITNDVPPAERDVWFVPIQGTTYTGAGWVAYCADRELRAGDLIRPSVTRCGYQVMSVSRHCVWLNAFVTDTPAEAAPSGGWPDIRGIRGSQQKPFDAERVELDNGASLKLGDAIVFQRSGTRLAVKRLCLWPQGVQFRIDSEGGAKTNDVVCILVQ
jgi:hypothetical protein